MSLMHIADWGKVGRIHERYSHYYTVMVEKASCSPLLASIDMYSVSIEIRAKLYKSLTYMK